MLGTKVNFRPRGFFFFWFASVSYDDTFFFLVRDVSFLNFQDPNNNLDLHVNDIP